MLVVLYIILLLLIIICEGGCQWRVDGQTCGKLHLRFFSESTVSQRVAIRRLLERCRGSPVDWTE